MSTPYIVPPCHAEPVILYRDEHLLLVEKPAGLLSVPGRHPLNRDSLITRLQAVFPQARTVHRLDLDTSGVMVVALHADSQRALHRLFAQRQVKKHYQAIVQGRVESAQGRIDLPLGCGLAQPSTAASGPGSWQAGSDPLPAPGSRCG